MPSDDGDIKQASHYVQCWVQVNYYGYKWQRLLYHQTCHPTRIINAPIEITSSKGCGHTYANILMHFKGCKCDGPKISRQNTIHCPITLLSIKWLCYFQYDLGSLKWDAWDGTSGMEHQWAKHSTLRYTSYDLSSSSTTFWWWPICQAPIQPLMLPIFPMYLTTMHGIKCFAEIEN